MEIASIVSVMLTINHNSTVDNTPKKDVVKKLDGFSRSLEGEQEFPPKLCSIKKIDIVFADCTKEESVVIK